MNPGGGHRGSGTQSPEGANVAPAGTPGCGARFTGGCPAEYNSVSPPRFIKTGSRNRPMVRMPRGRRMKRPCPNLMQGAPVLAASCPAPRVPAGPDEQILGLDRAAVAALATDRHGDSDDASGAFSLTERLYQPATLVRSRAKIEFSFLSGILMETAGGAPTFSGWNTLKLRILTC
jgi:hypothetical protein